METRGREDTGQQVDRERGGERKEAGAELGRRGQTLNEARGKGWGVRVGRESCEEEEEDRLLLRVLVCQETTTPMGHTDRQTEENSSSRQGK